MTSDKVGNQKLSKRSILLTKCMAIFNYYLWVREFLFDFNRSLISLEEMLMLTRLNAF